DLPAGERLDAGSRTARVVVEVGAGALGGVDLRPLLDGVLLCAGPGGVDAAGRAVHGAGGGTPRARRVVVVASAGGQGQRPRDDHAAQGGESGTDLHRRVSSWFRLPGPPGPVLTSSPTPGVAVACGARQARCPAALVQVNGRWTRMTRIATNVPIWDV